MLLQVPVFTLLLSALSSLTSAVPVLTPSIADTAAKAHNIYLLTCTKKTRKDAIKTSTVVAYFKHPINSTDNPTNQPDRSKVLSNYAAPWEGVNITATVWKSKTFSVLIDAGAQTLSTGSLAGSAMLKTEQYVCFKDGATVIDIDGDDDSRNNNVERDDKEDRKKHCVADYWCAGLGKPADDDPDDN
ncbi:hypothetical protein EJ04DRAFT_604163 [Polyplosphaeria fusca]|uniref:Uncharacterized protein n=1 Tax=Polyplosphaeria fusca TaxID=682080 RepID=A0A9P4QZP1_9PLEO|nr:hypothetical protein EJ04DRAFT_604163 [Polyplosphaeria fusca]